MVDGPQLATVRDSSGVEVSSYSQTADELRAALGMEAQSPTPPEPPKPNGAPPPDTPIGDEPEPDPGKEPSPESDAGKALAKKRSSLQARISELNREKQDTAAERDEARQRARRLEQELADLRKAPAGSNGNGKPSDTGVADRFPKYAEYLQTHPDAELEDWLEARDAWRDTRAHKEAATRWQAEAQQRAFSERAQRFNAKLQETIAHDPDVLASVDRRLLETKALSALAPGEQPTFGNFLVEQILHSEQPVKLLHHLSKESEIQRLAALDPNQVIRELARIEYGLGTENRSGPVPVAAPTSHAKPPVKPLGGSPPVDADEPPGDDASDDEHIAWYNRKELARQRRRG